MIFLILSDISIPPGSLVCTTSYPSFFNLSHSLVEKVFPAVEQGKIVICERFVDSSLAYQGFGRQIGMDEVLSINMFAIDNAFPDMTIYLDVD